jgi:hypothetical protein
MQVDEAMAENSSENASEGMDTGAAPAPDADEHDERMETDAPTVSADVVDANQPGETTDTDDHAPSAIPAVEGHVDAEPGETMDTDDHAPAAIPAVEGHMDAEPGETMDTDNNVPADGPAEMDADQPGEMMETDNNATADALAEIQPVDGHVVPPPDSAHPPAVANPQSTTLATRPAESQPAKPKRSRPPTPPSPTPARRFTRQSLKLANTALEKGKQVMRNPPAVEKGKEVMRDAAAVEQGKQAMRDAPARGPPPPRKVKLLPPKVTTDRHSKGKQTLAGSLAPEKLTPPNMLDRPATPVRVSSHTYDLC